MEISCKSTSPIICREQTRPLTVHIYDQTTDPELSISFVGLPLTAPIGHCLIFVRRVEYNVAEITLPGGSTYLHTTRIVEN